MKAEPAEQVVEDAVPVTTIASSGGNSKRKRWIEANSNEVRHRKRVALALTKPSHLLGVGFPDIRPENRSRLKRLLMKLFRSHNWVNACGVASVLLKSTQKERCSVLNRFKFSASMELLKHIESNRMKDAAISSIYDAWMARAGMSLVNRKRSLSNEESNIALHLESIVFLLLRGHNDSERQNARSLMQEHGFENSSVLTMVVGLIFYELWYSEIPDYMQLKVPDSALSSENRDDPPHSPVGSLYSTAGVDQECESVQNDGSSYVRSLSLHDTDTSVRMGKEVHLVCDGGSRENVIHVDSTPTIKRENSDNDQPRNFYAVSDGNEVSSDIDAKNTCSIPESHAVEKLEPWMFPLRFKKWDSEQLSFGDEYMFAVKCLQDSLHTEPSLAALLPLIQLLLIGREYKMALEEVESFSKITNTALLTRIRATLLELVDPGNIATICTCYEDTLKYDPTCSSALAKLITFHNEGAYPSESLIESIALHLEVAYPDHTVWNNFAWCFLRISQSEEDRMSACLPTNDGQKPHNFSVHYNRIPKVFMEGDSGKSWKLRWRWWSRRHFRTPKLSSNPTTDELELVTYKAACAIHMYGRESDFVCYVFNLLDKEVDRKLFLALQLHIRNCFGLHFFFQPNS